MDSRITGWFSSQMVWPVSTSLKPTAAPRRRRCGPVMSSRLSWRTAQAFDEPAASGAEDAVAPSPE